VLHATVSCKLLASRVLLQGSEDINHLVQGQNYAMGDPEPPTYVTCDMLLPFLNTLILLSLKKTYRNLSIMPPPNYSCLQHLLEAPSHQNLSCQFVPICSLPSLSMFLSYDMEEAFTFSFPKWFYVWCCSP
jgi:hypothetical protein